jgi:hypothetical protein
MRRLGASSAATGSTDCKGDHRPSTRSRWPSSRLPEDLWSLWACVLVVADDDDESDGATVTVTPFEVLDVRGKGEPPATTARLAGAAATGGSGSRRVCSSWLNHRGVCGGDFSLLRVCPVPWLILTRERPGLRRIDTYALTGSEDRPMEAPGVVREAGAVTPASVLKEAEPAWIR